MAKELPYFRFTVQEWQNGDITLEDFEAQGVFINVCCYYWLCNCNVTITKLKRRFSQAQATLESLIEEGIIKTNVVDDIVSINFLDEQWRLLNEKSMVLSKAGKKGYLAKVSQAKARLKGGLSYKDKDKEKDNDKDKINKSVFSFPDFWTTYKKNVGGADAALVYGKMKKMFYNLPLRTGLMI